MRKIFEVVFFILVLCAIVAAVSLVVILSKDAWKALQASDPNVVAAILIGCGTILIAVVVVAASRASDRTATLSRDQRDRRFMVYQELLDALYRFHYAPITGERGNRKELIKKLNTIQQKMILLGSESALQALIVFWDTLMDTGDDEDFSEPSDALADLLMILRHDMGQSSVGLDEDDIIRLFATESVAVLTMPGMEKS